MIYKDVVCWLLFCAKFDCNYIQSFVPCIYYGIWLQGLCDRERVCEDSSYWRLKRFSQVSRDLASRKVMHVPCTWLECEESVQMETAVSHEYLVGKTFLRDTCKTFCSARLYYLIHTFCTHTIYTHITHKW